MQYLHGIQITPSLASLQYLCDMYLDHCVTEAVLACLSPSVIHSLRLGMSCKWISDDCHLFDGVANRRDNPGYALLKAICSHTIPHQFDVAGRARRHRSRRRGSRSGRLTIELPAEALLLGSIPVRCTDGCWTRWWRILLRNDCRWLNPRSAGPLLDCIRLSSLRGKPVQWLSTSYGMSQRVCDSRSCDCCRCPLYHVYNS